MALLGYKNVSMIYERHVLTLILSYLILNKLLCLEKRAIVSTLTAEVKKRRWRWSGHGVFCKEQVKTGLSGNILMH